MDAKQAADVQKMTVAQLVNFDLVDSALLPNLQSQRDNAIAAVEKRDVEHTAEQKAHADALAAKEAEISAHEKEKSALQKDIEALGIKDTAEAAAFRKARMVAEEQAKIDRAIADKAEAEKKLAELEAAVISDLHAEKT